MSYHYQAEKLSDARRCLMLPHNNGIAQSIADAFHECTLAFHQLDERQLDDNALRWVGKIKSLMDTSGVSAPPHTGAWIAKARTLSPEQQLELAGAVDELARWFDRRFHDE